MIQYSCTTSLPVLRSLLSNETRVTLYIQKEEVATMIGSM